MEFSHRVESTQQKKIGVYAKGTQMKWSESFLTIHCVYVCVGNACQQVPNARRNNNINKQNNHLHHIFQENRLSLQVIVFFVFIGIFIRQHCFYPRSAWLIVQLTTFHSKTFLPVFTVMFPIFGTCFFSEWLKTMESIIFKDKCMLFLCTIHAMPMMIDSMATCIWFW